jgi:hypothetical protein
VVWTAAPAAYAAAVVAGLERKFGPLVLLDTLSEQVAPLCIFEHLVGENIYRSTMSITCLECQASKLINSDACPRPTTQETEVAWRGSAVVTKDLAAAARARGWALHRCLAVDDTPSTYARNPRNALPVPTWAGLADRDGGGTSDCRVLAELAGFLASQRAGHARGRPLDVRGWGHASPGRVCHYVTIFI